ncbi:rhamnan synthesis F family protein [Paraburkholderia fungorum]|uniref:rhamnan synthesis F family protein n=1 Tax=Paraburkholderia fungorum TaxID=134537 RepID=UPI00402B9933
MTAMLPATGERFLPESMSGEIALEHQHRYHLVAGLAKGRDILDVASGEGYGSALLASVARSVVGVDVAADAVEFATGKYASNVTNLRFVVGSCSALPLADASVDLVVSFETIEHHDKHEAMLAEIKRVLRPNGVLVISSPDRHEYSDVPGYRNPYHVKELYREEFEALLGRHFHSHQLYGQRMRHASTVFAIGAQPNVSAPIANYLMHTDGSTLAQSAGAIAPRYFIAVASDTDALPQLAVGTFTDAREDIRIEQLGLDLGASQQRAEIAQQLLADAQEQNRVTHGEVERLRREIDEWRKHTDALDARIAGQDDALHQLGENHAEQLRNAYNLGLKQGGDNAEGELAALKRELSGLRDTLSGQEAQMQRVIHSLSWRVTRPLRAGRRVLGMLKARQRAAQVETVVPRPPIMTSDFNETYYLRRYADIARAGIDPYQHFVTQGRREGRSGLPPKLLLRETPKTPNLQGMDVDRSKRGTVLVVSHEATRTGAPILAWNICRELRKQYHVVALLLGAGPLVGSFDEVCDAVAGPYSPLDRDAIGLGSVISELCERFKFDFAIVNSIASRAVLQSLAERYVPSTLLVHEFFKFHCSSDELVDAFAWASGVVFSAQVVQLSADIERTHPAVLRSHILPQGKSQIPADAMSDSADDRHAEESKVATRIEALKKKILGTRVQKPFIILGAGTIEYRKGVDLFVATAAEIKRLKPDADILMVWVGGVVENYKQYAEFVRTQVEQSQLEEHVVFPGETPDLEAIYEFADVCFISSRLDPLPNIALDAVTAGLPVLSFERATGVAENFTGDSLLERCILPFLNVEEAARRIIQLYESPAEQRALSERMLRLAAERFSMSNYVAQLTSLSERDRQLVEQEHSDVDTLMAGQDFADWFYLPPDSMTSRAEAIRQYVKSARSGIYVRKPAPGFYSHLYAAYHDLGPTLVNPFVHFIAAGKPHGEWQEQLIDVSQERTGSTGQLRIGVHVHAFYPDLLGDIARRLAQNDLRVDLLVSVRSQADALECRKVLSNYRLGSQTIRVVPNCGRDIGPFVTGFGAELMQYDVIGHFHTKKSVHVDPNSNLVRNWVNHLMETLVGGQHPAAKRILSAFAGDPNLGLVFADDPHQIGWDENRPFGKKLAEALGLPGLPKQFFPFPVGTMFWARPQALKPLFELGLGWEDYPAEPLPIDGSMLHALERLLPSIVQYAGFSRRVTYAPGITR